MLTRVIPQQGSEVINIPTKNGKTVAVILFPEELKIVEKTAMRIYQQTGTFSKSEAMRQLIRAGAKKIEQK